MNKKRFKAQALALVMIVLVVASIIGVSLFSRMAKDKEAAINEQDSSIASTQVDAMLDFLIGADIELLEEVLGESEEVKFDSMKDYAESFLLRHGIIDEATKSKLDIDWCPGQSKEKLSMTLAEPLDFFEIQPGSVMAFNLEGASADSSCELTLRLKAIENHSIFAIKRVYKDLSDIVTEDMESYCIPQGKNGGCPADIPDVEYESNLSSIEDFDNTNKVHRIKIDLNDAIYNNTVEIRFLPIKGVLGMAIDYPDCAHKNFKPIKITSEANCNNSYRGKQMFLPGSGSLGYSPLFDYGIYDSGLFQP